MCRLCQSVHRRFLAGADVARKAAEEWPFAENMRMKKGETG
jgi:hypothetical protein